MQAKRKTRRQSPGRRRDPAPKSAKPTDAKPGTDALRAYLHYFNTSNVPAGMNKAVWQGGATSARKVLEYLEAGNAEQAVAWTVHAMTMYGLIYSGKYYKAAYKNIEPYVNREINRRSAQMKVHPIPQDTLDKSIELMAKYHGDNPRPTKTYAAKMAARKLANEGLKVSYRTILKHLPSWLKDWNG